MTARRSREALPDVLRALAMVCDSTNVFVEGEAGSEAMVRASILAGCRFAPRPPYPQAVHQWFVGAAQKLAGCRCAPNGTPPGPPYLRTERRLGRPRSRMPATVA